jgi:hypothetical protein
MGILPHARFDPKELQVFAASQTQLAECVKNVAG